MSKKTLLYIAIFVGLICGYYSVKHYIGKRQAHIIATVIEGEFQEDMTFIGSFLPVICNGDNTMSIFITALLASAATDNTTDSATINRDLAQLVQRIPRRLNQIQPQNDWQRSFINTVKPCLQSLRNIQSTSNINSVANQRIMDSVKDCIQSQVPNNNQLALQAVSHFSNRALKNVTNNYNSFTDKFAIMLLGQGHILIEGKDGLIVLNTIRKAFMKNKAFKQAYNNGCLRQLDELAESAMMVYLLQNRGFWN